MLSMESMIAISSRRGGGGRQTPPSRFPEKFLRYLSFLSCSRDPGRAVEDAARGRETIERKVESGKRKDRVAWGGRPRGLPLRGENGLPHQ